MKSLETQFVELVFNELETKNEIEKTKDEMEAKKDDIRGKIWKWIHLPANQVCYPSWHNAVFNGDANAMWQMSWVTVCYSP